LHGLGREDIDARCLAWRPFVIEILEPRKRFIDIRKLAGKIDKKKVRIRSVRLSDIQEVRKIKEARLDKTYRGTVACKGRILTKDLEKLKQLEAAVISQKTPQRVVHRRADLLRKRKVKSVACKPGSAKQFMIEVTGEAGLYVKELVSGDSGRTRPSVSEILGNECVLKNLDVIKIHKKAS
jgi:tRNA pseudouridine synthase 10